MEDSVVLFMIQMETLGIVVNQIKF